MILENNNEVKKDSQARDWCVVVNNPQMTEKTFYDYLKKLTNIKYFVFVKEKGDGTESNPEGTEHHHCYMVFSAPKKFSTIKGYFSKENIGVNAYVAPRKYSPASCIAYVKKEGKFADKAHTRISDIFEYGALEQGKRNDLLDMIDMLKQGFAATQIFELYPNSFARYEKFIENMHLKYIAEKFTKQYRNLEVYYIYGPSRTGKTRYVYDLYGYENVYCNQGYTEGKWFDGYMGQDVLLLDEFRSSFDITLLLNYLDGHPLTVQCRYQNKVACYTKVYITSNIPLRSQYTQYALDSESRQALYNRINNVIHFTASGIWNYEKKDGQAMVEYEHLSANTF